MNLEKIGRYQIISELGRGGMATVYRAKDPNFDRQVAVKVLPRIFLHDPQFRARFEREAKTIAALEHTAIVPVYDFGEEDGQPYIVMRLMTGGTLADKLQQGKLSLDEAVQIITRLAPALDAAHQKGIVHRDLKPGNILFDQYGNAYLSDFGIARLAEGGGTLTGSGIVGTPAYMSPEQIQGEKNIDGRSDLYSMGVIFYQMLVGETPYHATTPAKIMMMHILEPVPDIRTALPSIPQGVVSWLEKVLAKDPDDRFPTAGEMAQALEDALRGEYPAQSAAQETLVVPGFSVDATQKSQPLHTPAQSQAPSIQYPPKQRPSQTPIPPEILAAPPPAAVQKGKKILPLILAMAGLFGMGAIAVIYLVLTGLQGNGPLAMLAPPTATASAPLFMPTATTHPTTTEAADNLLPENTPTATAQLPTATAAPPTDTPEPTATSTPEVLVLGGADKIAFLDNNDIWLMNVDGSDLQQLTNDGSEKTNLGWTPDGTAVTYISGKCIWYVEVNTLRMDYIACFETVSYLETFSISPDGTQVAISLNRELYVVPYDLEKLRQVRYYTDLKAMSQCPSLAPMLTSNDTPVPVKQLRWSRDGKRIAILKLANDAGNLVDLIQIFEIRSCDFDLIRKDEFPAARFVMAGYDKAPYIQNFGYDGGYLFALVSYIRNDGYGDLYIYNADLHRADLKVNPIDQRCCYRDPQFSPDGRYLIFVYQPYEAGAKARLYYIPYGTLGTGAKYNPLPLPDSFFSNPKVKPQPALRPAP